MTMNRRDTNGQSLLIQSVILSSEEWAVVMASPLVFREQNNGDCWYRSSIVETKKDGN
jgi:hypothetical protein